MWEGASKHEDAVEVEFALACFVHSQDVTQRADERLAALEASFTGLSEICERNPVALRLASLARVAAAYGIRRKAVETLEKLGKAIVMHNRVEADEPFLAASARFDALPPGQEIGNWMLASVLEELERLIMFSSFYAGAFGKPRLEYINQLGFASDEMKRRLALVNQRFGLN
jgi:hypothetical protein